ncbi:MAG: phosphoglycerate mutase family protein [Bacilli bacterium]|nr:phosphoglycerate mutase family protein [Bacilli bacterium]
MKVFIVRHGQVSHNLLGIYSNENEDLNKTGVSQAIQLREKIKKINYDIIICSPLIRAKHTANIINIKNRNIIIDNRLEERNPGNLSGKLLSITNRDEYWGYDSKIKYGTSENIVDFFDRVYKFLDELKTMDYNEIIIVAHSGISKAFSGYFEGIKDGMFLDRGLKNGEIKEYEF